MASAAGQAGGKGPQKSMQRSQLERSHPGESW